MTMKQGWEIKKLGEVATFCSGYTPKESDLLECGDVPYFKVSDMNHPLNSKYLQHTSLFLEKGCKNYAKNTIVFPKNGAAIATNKKRILMQDSVVDLNTGGVLASDDLVYYEYLYLYLLNIDFRLHTRRGAVPTLDIAELKQLPISVPPIEEQEKIVEELDCLSGIIEKKREQLKELDALAESIFYTMFGDPITNEKGWEVKKLGEVCDIINGFAFKSNLFRKEGDAILRISNIQNGYVDLSDAAYFDKSDYGKINFEKYAVKPYDIVIALSGATTGKLGINTTGKDLYLNQRVAICREKTNAITRLFLLYYLHNQSLKFLEDAAGVAQPNLSTEQMKEYIIGIPPIALQQEFADKIEAIEKQKELIKKSISEVEDLFNSRMAYYFN